jgi:putative DNA primase/helicase
MAGYPLTDIGNGMRFVRDWQKYVRWLIDEQEWRVWTGAHWRREKTDEKVTDLAKRTVVTIYDEAKAAGTDDERRAIAKWAVSSASAAKLSAMIRMAKSDSGLWSSYDEFDRQPYLLNFTNGTVDLRTGRRKEHDPADRISCLVPHGYNELAQAPLWEKLIMRCTQCDDTGETGLFLIKALGYSLIGKNPEQRFFPFVGPKKTGKSKILEITAAVLGQDYAIISQPKLVTKSKWGTHHDSETWSIRGKRLVAISETDAGMDLDEAMVKNLTGASVLSMRGLYRDRESQVPVTWTIIIGTNEEPNIERWDDAIGRRVIKIPSGPSLDESEVDLHLEEKILEQEAEGVLASLVYGCMMWYQEGLAMPDAVAEATREFEDANNHVAEFLHACVDFGEGYRVPLKQVDQAYQAHRGKGSDTIKSRALYSQIVEYCNAHGLPVTKDHRYFYGLQFTPKWPAAGL